MTAYKDMNTRRLKRAYLRAVKREWWWSARTGAPGNFWSMEDVREGRKRWSNRVETAALELRRRGWSA